MPRNYDDEIGMGRRDDQDFERSDKRFSGGQFDRDGRGRDQIRPEWDRYSSRGRDIQNFDDYDRRPYDPSFHRNQNSDYDRRNDYGFANDINAASWYPRNRASYAPLDSRDNLFGAPMDSENPRTENGSSLYGRSYSGRGPKGYRRSDDRIKEDVSDRLEQDHHVDASDIEVDVKEGLVTLRGTIHDRAAKRLAEDIAMHCRGVRDVRNELSIDQGFWQRAKDAIMDAVSDNRSDSESSARTQGKSKH